MTGYRMETGIDRGEAFHFTCDGKPVLAYPGESIAAALFAAGRRTLRTTARLLAPHGLYCGMGVCWECIMVADGKPAMRACVTIATPGMRVETQQGLGPSMQP